MKQVIKFVVVGGILLYIIYALVAAALRNNQQPLSPEAMAQAYIEALAAKDCELATSYKAPGFEKSDLDCDNSSFNPIISAKIRTAEFRGSTVTLHGDFKMTASHYTWLSLRMKNLDGDWYVQTLLDGGN